MSGATLAKGGLEQSPASGSSAVELKESGGRALKLQTDSPHLVSLGGDRFSTAVTLHPIPQGRVTLGSGPNCDIHVQGTGVQPLHCNIENSSGVVTLYPLSENIAIDGIKVTGPTRLSQGVMLTIGRSNYMRFNHPEEAKLIKSVLPNARISMTPIKFDVETEEDLKYNKKPPVIPRKSPRDSLSDNSLDEPFSSIQMKVSKFEYLAAQNFKKSISPKVFSSNLVTVNTPAKDVLGRAPPDLQDFAKNLPQSALNYSDSCFNDKQKNKTPDRQFFGRKSPQYVNVALNDTKAINNRVIIFENSGALAKNMRMKSESPPKKEMNNMNNKLINTSCEKPSNTNRAQFSPPSYNRNVSPNFRNNTLPNHRSVTPSPTSNSGVKQQHRRSGSLGELTETNANVMCVSGSLDDVAQRKNDAEIKRNQAQIDRIREQEIEKAEQARLEEILNMCAEYEKQVQWEKNNKVSTPNRIKTNGSLPRDKRQCLSPSPFGLPSPSHLSPSLNKSSDGQIFRFDVDDLKNANGGGSQVYDSLTPNCSTPNRRLHYENVDVRTARDNRSKDCGSMYENVCIVQPNNSPHYPQSPRTRIKTIPCSNKEYSPKEPMEIIENKLANLQNDKYSPQKNANDVLMQNTESPHHGDYKSFPTKFILPLEDLQKSLLNTSEQDPEKSAFNKVIRYETEQTSNFSALSKDEKEANKEKLEALKKEKQEILSSIVIIKRKIAEIEMQEEELNRELEMEKALIAGEYKSKLFELQEMEARKQILLNRAHELETKMEDCQKSQTAHQENCKQKLIKAQENVSQIEKQLSETSKHTVEYGELFEKYLEAQEVLDNERKTFEDLEFHQLEEEANWLASREEVQREILDLSQRMEAIKVQINDLEQQKVVTSRNNTHETETLEKKLIEYSRTLEEQKNRLKAVEEQLRGICKQESDQEISSDSESDSKENRSSFDPLQTLSFSMIETKPKTMYEDISNMSQSFNEKMLQEKSILDIGSGKKYPSQDDIDRISRVTSDAPMNIEDGRGSLGRKTIESLKEIERNRQLHLVQQGSQVIEQERRRVLALKQKVQHEVRTQWAQRRQDCFSLTSTESEDTQNSISGIEESEKHNGLTPKIDYPRNENGTKSPPEITESPTRPLSESSDLSLEVGNTMGKRSRQLPDKMRPLTRYLPIRSSELDLRQHIESAGHQVVLCPHVIINSTSCRGFLHKKGSKLNSWSRRWFVFDRNRHTLTYYIDKSEKKPRGGAYFQAIEEVYLDHSNSVKSPNPQLTFIVKTHERCYYLMAPSPEAMRIWIDVIFTGAEGYREYEHGT